MSSVSFNVTNLGVVISKEELYRDVKEELGGEDEEDMTLEEVCEVWADANINRGWGFSIEDVKEEE